MVVMAMCVWPIASNAVYFLRESVKREGKEEERRAKKGHLLHIGLFSIDKEKCKFKLSGLDF